MIKCTIVNTETGEIISENYKLHELKDKVRAVKFAEKKELDEQFKNMQQEYLGYFVFFIFENMDKLNSILNDSELAKFIYLGTYTKKEGFLILDDNQTYIDKKKLKKLMNLYDKTFRQFYSKIIENKLLIEEEEKLKINLDYFYRGREAAYKRLTNKKLKDFTRIYIKTTRDLYNDTPSNNHRKLSILYKLIPFVNWKYNILCHNTNETDKTKLKYISVSEVIDILEYDKTNITRFRKDFYSVKYLNYPVFGSFQKTAEYLESAIVVNPLVYYRGNDIKELEYLITLFNIEPM